MRQLLLLALLFLPLCTNAQNPKMDSLENRLTQDLSDTERIDVLGQLMTTSRDSLAIAGYAEKAISLAKQLADAKREAKLYRELSVIYPNLGDAEAALAYADKAIALADKLSKRDQVNNLAKKGEVYRAHLKQIDNAKEYLLKAEQINNQLPDAEKYPNMYMNLGVVYWIEGDMDAAENYYQESLRLERLQDGDISASLISLGNVDNRLGNFSDAIEHYLEALTRLEKDNSRNLHITLNNISGIYSHMKEYDKSIEYAQKMLTYSELSGDKQRILEAHLNLGTKYSNTDQVQLSKKSLFKGFEMAVETGRPHLIAKSTMRVAGIYTNSDIKPDSAIYYGLKAQQLIDDNQLEYFFEEELTKIMGFAYLDKGNYQKAEAYHMKSLAIAKEMNDVFAKGEAEKNLFELYEKQGNASKALMHLKQYNTLNDSIRSQSQAEQIADMQTKYETDKKEAENQVLLAKNDLIASQNLQYKIGAGILASLLALLGYFFFQLRKTRNQLAAQNQQLIDLNATKDKFFGIIAHDVRSPITALDGVSEQMNYYLKKDDKAKLSRLAGRIDTTAKRLTSLLDNLLNWALIQTGMIPYNPQSVDIQGVVQENIALFEPVAEAKNIKLVNKISAKSLVFSDESALSTIIRNLVNNAIKFTPSGGEVSIDAEEKQGKVFIRINDTGTGIAADKLEKLFSLEKQYSKGTAGEKGSGLGLMLCKELVELNKGTIRAISELGKGSSFVFSVPVS